MAMLKKTTSQPKGTYAIVDLLVEDSDGGKAAEIAFRRFNGITLLEWCIRRLSDSTLLDGIGIVGSESLRSQVFACGMYGARWFCSEAATSAERAAEFAAHVNAEWLLFATPNCPFMDPVLLDRLIASAWNYRDSDYVGFMSPTRPRFGLGTLGLVGELCGRAAIERFAKSPAKSHHGSVAGQIRSASDRFKCHLIPLPKALDRQEVQFALVSEEDWERAYLLMEAAGDDLSWQRLTSLSQPFTVAQSQN